MNFLNSFTIRTRIIALIIIPLIVTMLLSIERYHHASEKNEVAIELELLLNYIAKTSPLITGMQKETGLSRVWLSKNDPIAKSQLDLARSPINIAISDYLDFVASNKSRLEKYNLLSEQIEDVQKRLKLFKTVRMLVDQQKKNSKEYKNLKNENIWTLGEIEKLTASLILSTSAVVKLASADKTLSLMTNAYYNLIQALNSNVIAITAMKPVITGYLRIYNYGVIIKNDGIQQAHLKSFESLATDSTLAYYNQHLKETEQFRMIFDTHNDVRAHLWKKNAKKLTINPTQWQEITDINNKNYLKVINYILADINQVKDNLVEQTHSAVIATITLVLILLILIIASSILIINSISRPLKNLMQTCTSLASEKNMNTRIDIFGKDEISAVSLAFNSLIASFEEALKKVSKEAVVMNSTSEKVAQAMNESKKLSVSQQRNTDSISVSIEEMTTTIGDVSRMAVEAADTVSRAHEISVQSEEKSESSQNIMQNLIDELGNTATLVHDLNQEANSIGAIINVIQAISEQTNLLALNAAIEAARAGEQGRGFAVVAEEVRNLAFRTKESTEQIHQQIESLINGANASADKMTHLKVSGMQAIETVLESTQGFKVLKGEFDNITNMAAQIAVTTEQQSVVSKEMSERIHSVSDDSCNLAHHAELSLAATNTLLRDGKLLEGHIKEFKVSY